MWLRRGRFRTSDVLIILVALVAATVATAMITRADQRMNRGAQAERLLEEIAESEKQLYEVSVDLLSGDARADDVRRFDADGVLQVAEIESLEADLRTILAAVPPADRQFRQHVKVELSLVAASGSAAEYHKSYVVTAHEAATATVTDTYALLEEHNQKLRHRISEISIAAALLAVLVTALGVLLLNRTRRARAEAEGVQLAQENQRLRDQTAVAELVVRVARAADATDSVERLLERALGHVCVHAGWPIGHLWLRASDGGLMPSDIWHCEETGRFPLFREATAELGHAADETLPGRAAATREAVWIDDIRSETLPRALAARAEGLTTALAFPIVADGEVIAVFELATDRPLPKDRALLEIAKALAVQLGDFAERKAADVERRRLAAIVASSGDAIFATDADNCLTSWNAAAEELTGGPATR